MALKVGIIGPTNMRKLVKLTGKSEQFFLKKADTVISLAALVGAPLCDQDTVAATSINRDAVIMMIKAHRAKILKMLI